MRHSCRCHFFGRDYVTTKNPLSGQLRRHGRDITAKVLGSPLTNFFHYFQQGGIQCIIGAPLLGDCHRTLPFFGGGYVGHAGQGCALGEKSSARGAKLRSTPTLTRSAIAGLP